MTNVLPTRAEQFVNIFYDYFSEHSSIHDVKLCISRIINQVADRLCTDWGELQHPVDVIREMAEEIDNLNLEELRENKSYDKEFAYKMQDMVKNQRQLIFVVKSKFINYVSLIDCPDHLTECAFRDRMDAETYIDSKIAYFVYTWNNDQDRFITCMSRNPSDFETEEQVVSFARKHYRIERVYLFE